MSPTSQSPSSPPPATTPPSDATREKARRLLRDGHVYAGFRVQGTGAVYTVDTDANPVTQRASYIYWDCEHGRHHGSQARCSHALAVVAAIREGRVLPPFPGEASPETPAERP